MISTESEKKILRFLIIFSLFGLVSNYSKASWLEPTNLPPADLVGVPVNIGPDFQSSRGTLNFNNATSTKSAVIDNLSVGRVSGTVNRGDVVVEEKTKALSSFCLGSVPSPNGCISRWLDLSSILSSGFYGGQAGKLVKWMSPTSINEGKSSLSENPTSLSSSKKIEINSLTPNESGLRLSHLANPSSITGLQQKNKVLTLDASGNVILANITCTP